MSSEVKANKWSPGTGVAGTLGDSGDTFTVPSGATLAVASGATLAVTGATVTGLSAGKVLQVVSSMFKGSSSTTSTTMTSTGLAGTITPTSTSNKILLHISFAVAASGGDAGAWVQLFKDGSLLSGSLADVYGNQRQGSTGIGYNAGDNNNSFSYLDSPSTTSATTYTLMYAISPGRPAGQTLYINRITTVNQSYYSTSPATMILMEIEG